MEMMIASVGLVSMLVVSLGLQYASYRKVAVGA